MADIYSQSPQNQEVEIGKICARTLIIVGNEDRITDPEIGKKQHLKMSNSVLEVIPNASHFAHIEQPTAFYKRLDAFLTSV